jgi:mono/diheme cytochrome c family protein
MRPDVKLRTVLLTTAAFALAAACTPAAEGPAPETPAAAEIAEPTTPSGPAAENTTDSLASTPAAGAPTTDTAAATPAPVTPAPAAAAGPTAEELANGKAAYAQTCAMCHGPTGAGTQMGVALTAGLDYAAVKEKIVKGKIAPTDTMPPMGAAYSEAQLDDLAKFVEAGLPQ